MSIGTLIRDKRKKENITAEKLSKLTGISRITITYIENGKRQPNIEHIKRIFDILGMDIPTEYRGQLDKSDTSTIKLSIKGKNIGTIYYKNNYPVNYAFEYIATDKKYSTMELSSEVLSKILECIKYNREDIINVDVRDNKFVLTDG